MKTTFPTVRLRSRRGYYGGVEKRRRLTMTLLTIVVVVAGVIRLVVANQPDPSWFARASLDAVIIGSVIFLMLTFVAGKPSQLD